MANTYQLQVNNESIQDLIEYVSTLPTVEELTPVFQSKTVAPTTSAQTVNPDEGYDGLSKVVVEAMPTATQATPSITIDTNGLITARAIQSTGYVSGGTKTATKQMTTMTSARITPSKEDQVIVSSGTYVLGDITVAAVIEDVPELQTKTVAPQTYQQTVTADSGYDGLSMVQISAMPTAAQAEPVISVSDDGLISAASTQSAGYVTAGTKTSTMQLDTLAAKTVAPTTAEQTIVEAGTYVTGDVVVSAMPTVTQAIPSISVSSGGLITASATQTAGYVSQGTKSATKQLDTLAATTVAPATTEQTVVEAGTYVTGDIIVEAMPAGTSPTVTLSDVADGAVQVDIVPSGYYSGTHYMLGVRLPSSDGGTITPSTTAITLGTADTVLLNDAIVEGDENLVPEHIVKGVSIFGVEGTASNQEVIMRVW